MIRKIILLLFIQIIFYSLFINVFDFSWVKFQGFEQANLVKSEQYLYEEQNISKKAVIVGTSLSAILDNIGTTDYFINLSLHGLCVFDGLKLIKEKGELPQRVYIEMNKVLLCEFGESHNHNETKPILESYAKRNISIVREKNRPLDLLATTILKIPSLLNTKFQKSSQASVPIKEEENSLKTDNLLQLKTELSQKPNDKVMNTCFDLLKEEVKYLKNNGVNVVFFEMPLEEVLCDLEEIHAIRNRFFIEFPPSEFLYLKQPSCLGYETTDGIHLTLKSVEKYIPYFLEENKKLDAMILSNQQAN